MKCAVDTSRGEDIATGMPLKLRFNVIVTNAQERSNMTYYWGSIRFSVLIHNG
ncbi:hypothetical protein KTT_06170 [Tengunoibacter tsumagoiensis]|uniref:Uncharacterized protein n=1 Tax=Tengunoibacter tsumagoiensis TaxID=2014871 RepID=A0A401ZUY5_9CHLR|nr:hypothetical protein KTT_06170 [Tengunoibacter tsumagoiensis]